MLWRAKTGRGLLPGARTGRAHNHLPLRLGRPLGRLRHKTVRRRGSAAQHPPFAARLQRRLLRLPVTAHGARLPRVRVGLCRVCVGFV